MLKYNLRCINEESVLMMESIAWQTTKALKCHVTHYIVNPPTPITTTFLPLCLFWGCSLWQQGLQLCPEVWPQHLPPLCPHWGDRCAKHWGGPGHSAPPTATSATRSTYCWCLLHSTHTSCLHLQTQKSRSQLNAASWAKYQAATFLN